MADNEPTPVEEPIEVKAESKGRKLPVDVGSMGNNVKNVTDMLTDADARKRFMTSEDMEPHRMLAILLGLTFVITVIVALVSMYI